MCDGKSEQKETVLSDAFVALKMEIRDVALCFQ